MKKFIYTIFMVMIVGLLASCGSTRYVGIEQRSEEGLPKWAGHGVSFISDNAEYYNAPKQKESGFYSCGMSENKNNPRLTADNAALSAKKVLAGYISTELKSTEKRESGDHESYQQIDESYIYANLEGVLTVDNYTDKNGNCYVLVFVSDSSLKKITSK